MTFRQLFTRLNMALISLMIFGLLVIPGACSGAQTARINIAVVGDDVEEWRPTETSVKAGGTVIWYNSGIEAHLVISNEGLWESRQLLPGQSFNFTFANPGTYTYRDEMDTWEGMIYVK